MSTHGIQICLLLWLQSGFACNLLAEFGMPSLAKDGDIMVGGIFPVYVKQNDFNASFEKEPPKVPCKG